jgi:hypothetical protein
MSTHFDYFTRLSAELRAMIWRLALEQEHESEHHVHSRTAGRHIELYHYDPMKDSISVAISRPYPRLFAVDREARYEAARFMDATWVPLKTSCRSPLEPTSTSRLEICISFKLDTIIIRTRFLSSNSLRDWLPVCPTLEQCRLETLAHILDHDTIQRIQSIAIDAEPPTSARRLDIDAWWEGEGMDIFCPGQLRHIMLVTKERSKGTSQDYPRWVAMAVKD